MKQKKPSVFYYRLTQAVAWVVSTFIFKRRIVRNEIKRKKGAFVVIANHEAMLDFVNLIVMARSPMVFVISNSFYSSLPLTKFMDKMGVIPKQQFQTTVKDLKKIKATIDSGTPVVIYPAGLMCEDGLSTPIPSATYKFLKWLNTDVYAARTSGTYFVTPKWAKGMRPGRTYMDVYKLFSKEEIAAADIETIRKVTDNALLYDAYRDQEKLLAKYKNNENIEGLENVLYLCPHCRKEFTMQVRDGNTIFCSECGYEQAADEYAFLHNKRGIGEELRYVSDWSRLIYQDLKERIAAGEEQTLSAKTKIHMIDFKKHKYVEAGEGMVVLNKEHFKITGILKGEAVDMTIPIANLPTLPFSPGKRFEVQHGQDIYRCVLEEGKLTMKFINMVKIFYEMNRVEE